MDCTLQGGTNTSAFPELQWMEEGSGRKALISKKESAFLQNKKPNKLIERTSRMESEVSQVNTTTGLAGKEEAQEETNEVKLTHCANNVSCHSSHRTNHHVCSWVDTRGKSQ